MLMRVIFIIVGLGIGASQSSVGAVIGAVVGYLFASNIELLDEVREFKRALEQMRAALNALQKSSPTVNASAAPLNDSLATSPETTAMVPLATEASAPRKAVGTSPTDLHKSDPIELPSFNKIWAWLAGDNPLVRIGALVLFLGVVFLAKYAAEHAVLPIEYRYGGIAALSVSIFAIGWRLRTSRASYALPLQGLSIAICYVNLYAANRLHDLIPDGPLMAMLVMLCMFSVVVSVLQNSLALAVMGLSGGFLTPIVVSNSSGSHIALFSYYLALNVAVALIAWFKAWRPLNILSFVFTVAVGSMWALKSYTSELFASTEFFLIIFFLLYFLIALLYAQRRLEHAPSGYTVKISGHTIDYVDGTLVFGNPLVFFSMQYELLQHVLYGPAMAALALGSAYCLIAKTLKTQEGARYALLSQSFVAIGIIFLTLSIPLALGANWTAASWAIEAAGVFWVGCKQGKPVARGFALLLISLAGLSLFMAIEARQTHLELSAAVLAVSAAAVALFIDRYRTRLLNYELQCEIVSLLFSLMWWWIVIDKCNDTYFTGAAADVTQAISILSFSLLALLYAFVALRCRWFSGLSFSLFLLPVSVVFFLPVVFSHDLTITETQALAWLLTMISLSIVLGVQGALHMKAYLPQIHGAYYFLLASVATAICMWGFSLVTDASIAWRFFAFCLVPVLSVYLLSRETFSKVWPLSAFKQAYGVAGLAISVVLWLVLLVANWLSDGSTSHLPFVPVLNPLDIANLLVLYTIAEWLHSKSFFARIDGQLAQIRLAWLAPSVLYVLSAALLRALHHWANIPYQFDALMASTLVQTGLSLFWSVLAVATMVYATRTAQRNYWLGGAALMGVVVLKLFVLDLSNVATVERIVSFMGVGGLLLGLGYFSPMPPANKQLTVGNTKNPS